LILTNLAANKSNLSGGSHSVNQNKVKTNSPVLFIVLSNALFFKDLLTRLTTPSFLFSKNTKNRPMTITNPKSTKRCSEKPKKILFLGSVGILIIQIKVRIVSKIERIRRILIRLFCFLFCSFLAWGIFYGQAPLPINNTHKVFIMMKISSHKLKLLM